MQLGFAGGLGTFEHLFDQVNAAARPVELVAQQLVGRAGGGAKPAVHAAAQDFFSRQAVRGTGVFGGKRGVHGA